MLLLVYCCISSGIIHIRSAYSVKDAHNSSKFVVKVRILVGVPNNGVDYEYVSVDNINITSVSIKLKFLNNMLTSCKNDKIIYQVKCDIKSYMAIKKLLEMDP